PGWEAPTSTTSFAIFSTFRTAWLPDDHGTGPRTGSADDALPGVRNRRSRRHILWTLRRVFFRDARGRAGLVAAARIWRGAGCACVAAVGGEFAVSAPAASVPDAVPGGVGPAAARVGRLRPAAVAGATDRRGRAGVAAVVPHLPVRGR